MWHLYKLVLQSRNLSCREGAADLSQQSNSTSSHQSSTSSSLSTGSSSRSREVPAPGRSRASSSALRPSQIWPFVMASMRRWSSASRYGPWILLLWIMICYSLHFSTMGWTDFEQQKSFPWWRINMATRFICYCIVIQQILLIYSKQSISFLGFDSGRLRFTPPLLSGKKQRRNSNQLWS